MRSALSTNWTKRESKNCRMLTLTAMWIDEVYTLSGNGIPQDLQVVAVVQLVFMCSHLNGLRVAH
jgi:hypothetical protein